MRDEIKKTINFRYLFLSSTAILIYLALIKFLIHMFTIEYGYHRDELFYMTISENMNFNNLSVLPLTPAVLAIIRWLLGNSLKALHFLPAFCGALIVLFTGFITRNLGGKKFALTLAAIAVIIPPGYLGMDSLFTYDMLDKLFWIMIIYILVLIIKKSEPRFWLLFGIVMGLGLLNKISILFLGFAIFAALLLTPERKYFTNKWFWIGSLIAGLFLFPFLYWQATQGWPILSYGKYYSASKTYPVSFLEFTWFQILGMHPFTLPIWISGLGFTFFSLKGKEYRIFGWVYLILFVLFFFMKAKFYFLTPVYPFLIASGAIVVEGFIEKRNWDKLKGIILSLIVIGGIITAPMAMPVLPVETFIKITGFSGGDAGMKQERHEIGELPQHFADRFGWEEMANTVANVYSRLPEEEKSKACIFTGNYGEAGAIRFFGKKYCLPEPISGHGWHYYQGTKNYTGEIVIFIGISKKYLQSRFDEVIQADIFRCQYCMPYENNQPVYVCRNPKQSLKEILEDLKHFD